MLWMLSAAVSVFKEKPIPMLISVVVAVVVYFAVAVKCKLLTESRHERSAKGKHVDSHCKKMQADVSL